MRIGIPREIKTLEGRVGLIPEAARELVNSGHDVFVETTAGQLSGYSDDAYKSVGVQIMPDAQALYESAQMVVKVKEPIEAEYPLLRKDHILFSFLHLAANLPLLSKLQEIGLTAIAFETVEQDGKLPLLAPMSDIAGRVASQIGATLLYHYNSGRGILLGGLPASERGRVVILGAGVAGTGAATVAAALGAEVVVFDRRREALEKVRSLGANVTALYSYSDLIEREVKAADLLVGAVLVVGEKAPHLVSADDVRAMKGGSVIIDISVDQGGCIETTRPTSYEEPTFVWEDVVHFGVTNMPGAVPRSASQALSASLIPYVQSLAGGDWQKNPALQAGVNVREGRIMHPALLKIVS